MAAALLAGCTTVETTDASLDRSSWRVVAINAAPSAPYVVRFAGGHISGELCNRFDGPYQVAGGVLQLRGMRNTERGCLDPSTQAETAVFAILGQAMRITWHSGRRMTLGNAAGSLALERLP